MTCTEDNETVIQRDHDTLKCQRIAETYTDSNQRKRPDAKARYGNRRPKMCSKLRRWKFNTVRFLEPRPNPDK